MSFITIGAVKNSVSQQDLAQNNHIKRTTDKTIHWWKCAQPRFILVNMGLFSELINVPCSACKCDDHVVLFEKKANGLVQERGNRLCSNPGVIIYLSCNLVEFSYQYMSSLCLEPFSNNNNINNNYCGDMNLWLCSPGYFRSGQNWWRSAWSGSGRPSAQDTCLRFPESGRGWGTCSACDEPCGQAKSKIHTGQTPAGAQHKPHNYRIRAAALD